MEFHVEIRETWLKKIVFDTKTRTDALAEAKVWYINHGGGETGICEDDDAKRIEVDFQLQWPDGRPVPPAGEL